MLLFVVLSMGSVSGIGVDQVTHPPPTVTIVKMLKDNGFQKV
jgi:hypothetical protein